MDGHRVLAVNTSLLVSEAAAKLAEGRSRDGGIDVSKVAKRRANRQSAPEPHSGAPSHRTD